MTKKSLPEGTMHGVDEQIFAIGDIHGELDALHGALEEVRIRRDENRKSHLIFLGDLIDRGPSGLQCMTDAWNADDVTGVDKVTVLMGNHEMMMFSSMFAGSNNQDPHWWVRNGGSAVLNEIDARSTTKLETLEDYATAALDLIPDRMIEHMKETSHVRAGKLLFVHAGIRPAIDTEEELSEYLTPNWHTNHMTRWHWAWIRDEFLAHGWGFGPDRDLIIVHGHSPTLTDGASPIQDALLERGISPKKKLFDQITPDELYEEMEAVNTYDMVESLNRINLDGGCGKFLSPVPVLELKDNQYEIALTAGMKYERKTAPSV
jgi:serine/threonine protein phosphatase 1